MEKTNLILDNMTFVEVTNEKDKTLSSGLGISKERTDEIAVELKDIFMNLDITDSITKHIELLAKKYGHSAAEYTFALWTFVNIINTLADDPLIMIKFMLNKKKKERENNDKG